MRRLRSASKSHAKGQSDYAEASKACVGDAEGQSANAEQQNADAGGFRVTQRPGGLTVSFRLCWRGFCGADFPNIFFRIER